MDRNGHPNVLIVGSGPAAVSAALAFCRRGVVPTLVDVGFERDGTWPEIAENFYDYASRHDVSQLLVGRNFEGLYNLNPDNPHVSFNLTVPKNRYVVRGTDELLPLEQHNISVVQSLTRGGLANAWGGAAFRYNDRDLARFPITARDLEPFYDLATQEIGINGADDDLTPFYGSVRYLQPPLPLPVNSARIMARYERRKARLNRAGVYVGHMRSAILTRDLAGRKAHPRLNTDLFGSLSCTWSPIYTLDRLLQNGQLRYLRGVLVERWSRDGQLIRVHGRHVERNEPVALACDVLVLAAGAINSAKIVLRSYDDCQTRLPVADNPVIYIPFFLPGRIGKRLDVEGYGSTAIACVYDFDGFSTHLNAPIFEITTVPRAEMFRHMPFTASMNAMVMKEVLPAMVVMLLYFPSDTLPTGTLQLAPDGHLVLSGPDNTLPLSVVRRVIRLNRKLGLYSHVSLAERTIYGGSIHYVGMLPMRRQPRSRYETDAFGRLAEEENVYVVDGAVLPSVSSKNHTLTIMANAMRICTELSRRWQSSG